MPLPKSPSLSPAGSDLGLSDMLSQQVAGETEEMRKKRMAQMQQQSMMGPGSSPAAMSLLGAGSGGMGAA